MPTKDEFMKSLRQILFLSLATVSPGLHSREIVVYEGSSQAIQAAINQAESGDTIIVRATTATWDSGIVVPSTKALFVDGSGIVVTRGQNFTGVLFSVSTNSSASTRISNFHFRQTSRNRMMSVKGVFSNPKFRIDHSTFFTSAGQAILLEVTGAWGLIDNCSFTGNDASELVHNLGHGATSTAGWEDDLQPGSSDALYIEDCTFSKYDLTTPYFWGTSGIQSYYGSRTVVRRSTFNYCQVDQHGTAGAIGARWWEIYDNTFTIPTGGSRNQSSYMDIRAGSGVIFNNRAEGGKNLGAGVIVLREEDSGYPALFQIGRGKNQQIDPTYCWDNTAATPSSGSSNVVSGRDFFPNTKRPNYMPLEYPHPLRLVGASPSEPVNPSASAPANAKILIESAN